MAPKAKKGQPLGRPVLADAERRDTLVRVLTTAGEYDELKTAAADASMSVSTWVRSVAVARARVLAVEKEALRDRGKR